MRKSTVFWKFLSISAIALVLATPVSAADIRASHDSKKSIFTVGPAEAVKNLYAFAGQLIVNANPSKDLTAAGGNVTINGSTPDDLLVAGGTVNVLGNVGGSARILGGTVNIDSTINDDLAVLGGNVILSAKAIVNQDLAATSVSLALNGPVHGNVKVASTALYINSLVSGNVNFTGSRLQLGPQADIRGNIDYTSGAPYDRDANAKVAGSVNYHQSTGKNAGARFRNFIAAGFLLKVIAVILAGLFLLWVMRRKYEAVSIEAENNFWKNVGWGLLMFVAVPIAAFILAITLAGIYIALILFFAWILALFFAWIAGATAFGMRALKFMNRGSRPTFRYGPVALALLISMILSGVPVLGALFALILTLAGLGGIFKQVRADAR